MSKKDLIKEYKNGWLFEKGICYDVARLVKRYLQNRTCKMTSQQKQKMKEEAAVALKERKEV